MFRLLSQIERVVVRTTRQLAGLRASGAALRRRSR
jgi:hypothetical protein